MPRADFLLGKVEYFSLSAAVHDEDKTLCRIAVSSSVRISCILFLLPTRDHSFACRQVIFHDRPSRDCTFYHSHIDETNHCNSYVPRASSTLPILKSLFALTAIIVYYFCCALHRFYPQKNEQILICNCTEAFDAAPATVCLGKGSAELVFCRPLTTISVSSTRTTPPANSYLPL